MPTQVEQITTFFKRRPGTIFTLDEISEGSGVPRKSVSALITAAKGSGLPLVNPLPGQWGMAETIGDERPNRVLVVNAQATPDDGEDNGHAHNGHEQSGAVYQELAEQDSEQSEDEDEDEDGAAPVSVSDTITVSLGSVAVSSSVLVLLHVGHDRAGNRIVASQEGCAYRLIEL